MPIRPLKMKINIKDDKEYLEIQKKAQEGNKTYELLNKINKVYRLMFIGISFSIVVCNL